jgi:hypothetical protein
VVGILETVEPIEIDRWKNRRKMAWLAMGAGLLFPVLILFSNSNQLGAIAAPFYVFVGMVVATYIGAAVVDDHWQKDNVKYIRSENVTDRGRG